MPVANEVAVIEVNGREFRDWETVLVYVEMPGDYPTFTFTVSEGEPLSKSFAELQIKPDDECKITLAGQLAVTGIVTERQTYYDAHRHGVSITGQGRQFIGIVDSIKNKKQYNNQTLVDIAKDVWKEKGIEVITGGDTTNMMKKIPDAMPQTGEGPHHFIERLARPRGVWIGGDREGRFILFGGVDGGNGTEALIEGKNIQWCRAVISNTNAAKEVEAIGQARSDKDHHGKSQTNKSFRVVNSKLKRDRYFALAAEHVLDTKNPAQDLKVRANYEMAWHALIALKVEVGVYGWLRADGSIWQCTNNANPEFVRFMSPMAMINEDLFVHGITFTQDSAQGTMTTLDLRNQQALSINQPQYSLGGKG